MNKIKRNENFSLCSVLILSVMLVGGIIIAFHLSSWLGNSELSEFGGRLERMLGYSDKVDDVEGYGIIMNSFTFLIALLGQVFLYIFMIVFAVIISLAMIILAVIARLVYSDKSRGRLIAYRIITGICYAVVIISCMFFSMLFFTDWVMAAVAAVYDITAIYLLMKCINRRRK